MESGGLWLPFLYPWWRGISPPSENALLSSLTARRRLASHFYLSRPRGRGAGASWPPQGARGKGRRILAES